MLCSNPWKNKETGLEVGCGSCYPCKINRRKIWATRLFLEGLSHSQSCFVTLTYAESSLPNPPSLQPTALTGFLNAVKLFFPEVRYFAIGEYGPLRQRPHYHGLFFGVKLQKAALDFLWPHGFTDSSEFNLATAAYVAGYLADKLKHDTYPDWKIPPFARMSCKPGIGSGAIPRLVAVCKSEAGQKYIARVGDVPDHVKFDGKLWPIGSYLQQKCREGIGLENKAARQARQLEEQELIENTPDLYDDREARRQVAKDRAAAWHRRRRLKLKL